MKRFGRFIAKNRVLIFIIALVLLIPSFYGMAITKVNYDMLSYLPKNMDSVKGQNILNDTFSNAASSMLIVQNMGSKDVVKLKDKISKIGGVNKVIWTDDLIDTSIPKEILPDEVKSTFYSKDSTMLVIRFDEDASSDTTQNAITSIRKAAGRQCFLSGASAIIKDTKDLSDKETPIYVLLAVILSMIVIALTMESTLIPFIFLAGMAFAILYNMGTNVFLGKVSYITKSIAAVLQLGVTMDYSIFLYHRYEEEKLTHSDKNEAMAEAISKTFTSIAGSSLTTMAGFLALCTMRLTLGRDIGLVMAKGVLFGVITTVTVLPSLLLIFDKPIDRFSHKTVLPQFDKAAHAVCKKYKVLIAVFVLAFIPAVFGNSNVKEYYNLDDSLPKSLPSIVATNKLKQDYNMTTTHFIILKSKVPSYKVKDMIDKIQNVDGIEKVIGYDKYIDPSIPQNFIPQDVRGTFEKNGYRLIIANSKYKAARDEENKQIDEINKIIKSYDKDAVITGEGPLTKDLIKVADKDFKSSNIVSIAAVFAIILVTFTSFSIPIFLIIAIELAIFINMSIPYYMGVSIPFVASIVIGCIQLGATVDYAILMTTRFREEIRNGKDKFDAMETAVKGSAKSIVTSALTFFAATAGVGIISNLAIVKSLCAMMARGALISMGVIIFILPSILLVSENFISHTSRNWRHVPVLKISKKA